MCILMILTFIILGTCVGNSYLELDYNDPELAVFGVLTYAFVWIFVRIAPLALIGSFIGIFLTRKK